MKTLEEERHFFLFFYKMNLMFSRLDKFVGPIFEGAYIQNRGRGKEFNGVTYLGGVYLGEGVILIYGAGGGRINRILRYFIFFLYIVFSFILLTDILNS